MILKNRLHSCTGELKQKFHIDRIGRIESKWMRDECLTMEAHNKNDNVALRKAAAASGIIIYNNEFKVHFLGVNMIHKEQLIILWKDIG